MTTIVLKRITPGLPAATIEINGVLRERVTDVRLFPRYLRVTVTSHTGEIKNNELVSTTEAFVGDNITITVE